MKKYYLHDGQIQTGPFSIDELEVKQITGSTHIWYDGLPDWTRAELINELNTILKKSSPPLFNSKPITDSFPQQQNIQINVPQPKYQKWSPGVAAVLSLIIPGVGQMYKGDVVIGILWLIFVPIGYFFLFIPGLILHLICIITAATGDPYR
jgi:TM2 domain-containing membrane protein YozV